jgi:hypothetical protein
MKKILLSVFIFSLVFPGFIKAQQLYSNIGNVVGYLAGDALASNQLLFDDVEIPDALVGSEDSISITRVDIGIDRFSAETDTFTLYYSPLNPGGSGNDTASSWLFIPPTAVATLVVPDTAATNSTSVISFGDSVHTLFKVAVPATEILPGYKTFFISVLPGANNTNGWNISSGGDSANIFVLPDGGLWFYTEPNNVQATSISLGGPAVYATMSIAVYGAEGVFPVAFINFDGVLQNNEALLTWSTASETNNKGFDVEKSADGQNFASIGFVNSNGQAKGGNYTFSDPKLVSGNNYYRLKQEDLDGKFNYSSIINLQFSKFDWSVLGNPSDNEWIQLQLDKEHNVSIQVLSLGGEVIQTINKGTLEQGTYSIPLSLRNAAAGMYMVKLTVDGQVSSKNIVK